MNDHGSIAKAFYSVIDLGVSPTDVYIFSQIVNSEEGFALDDGEILYKIQEIRESIDKDYMGKLSIDGHISKILVGGYDDYYDDDEELM